MSPLKKIDWQHVFSWKRLYDYFFLRTVLGLFGFRHPGLTASHTFIPFFQYKIGRYENDYNLHFLSQPTYLKYTIEFFQKMREYTGHALVGYLEFHYNAYPDKKEFLRFLRYEVTPSGNRKPSDDYKRRNETILIWVDEQENILDRSNLRETPADNLENAVSSQIDTFQGKIRLTHPQHAERLIQVFLILQNCRAPGKKIEPLFKNFHKTDMLPFLRQLEIYGDLKANTIQGKITEANESLNNHDPKVERLEKALTDFFYGSHS